MHNCEWRFATQLVSSWQDAVVASLIRKEQKFITRSKKGLLSIIKESEIKAIKSPVKSLHSWSRDVKLFDDLLFLFGHPVCYCFTYKISLPSLVTI